jgi:hypothetical protein
VVEDGGSESDSELRRRAAWLLGLLALVAVLFVVLMTQLIGGGKGGDSGGGAGGPRALVSAVAGSSGAATEPSAPPSSSHTGGSPTRHPASASSSPSTGAASCPTRQVCVIDGDLGGGIDAINAYRTQHGQSAVTGRVSNQAQQCALQNGNGCSGGWAETELAKPKGDQAVQKILPFAHLLDPNVKSFEVGWAYDPGAKLYYFAIIRND